MIKKIIYKEKILSIIIRALNKYYEKIEFFTPDDFS